MKVRARKSVTVGQLIKITLGPLVRKRFSLRSPQFNKHDANTKAHNTDYNTKDSPILSFDVYYTLRTSFTPQPDSYCYAVTVPLYVVLYVAYAVLSAVSNPTAIVAPSQCLRTFISGVPRNFVRGGGDQQIQLSREDRQNGDLKAVAPLVSGSGGSCNLVQEISFHIVKFSLFLVI